MGYLLVLAVDSHLNITTGFVLRINKKLEMTLALSALGLFVVEDAVMKNIEELQ